MPKSAQVLRGASISRPSRAAHDQRASTSPLLASRLIVPMLQRGEFVDDVDRDFDSLVDAIARESGFSGAVLVDRAGSAITAAAYGLADRRTGIAVDLATQFGLASGTKMFTALTVMSLIESGQLQLDLPVRGVLGSDLPLIADDVTIEHLLSHRSGIGDYLDESLFDDITDFELPVPAQRLWSTEQYVPILDGHPMVSTPGAMFEYNNGGYVVLALVAERAAGKPFEVLVRERVCDPAGADATRFLRSDELPTAAAFGYLHADGLRTNVFHLPVLGSGDGGIYSTVADISAVWRAFIAGRIVSPEGVHQMLVPRRGTVDNVLEYGLGVWLHRDGVLECHGYDAGVSFFSLHDPLSATTCTAISNTGSGTGPLEELLARRIRQ
jgi:CubicO group peptidase (beta-lactamase class C family)